jgi:hypothetical protein
MVGVRGAASPLYSPARPSPPFRLPIVQIDPVFGNDRPVAHPSSEDLHGHSAPPAGRRESDDPRATVPAGVDRSGPGESRAFRIPDRAGQWGERKAPRIGPEATLDLTPDPGLTLVVGRNGSGKSSFAEGLELLLTGDTYRWSQRSKVWRDGWRNLHHPKAALIRWICILPFQPPRSRNEATCPRDALSSFRQLILESIPYLPRGVTWPAPGGEQWTRGGCGTIASDGAQ